MKTTPFLLALIVGLSPLALPTAASAEPQVRVYDHASGQWLSGDRRGSAPTPCSARRR